MRKLFSSIKDNTLTYWKKLGPGLITGASDDDPSGIATYSQAGAKFGLSLLWTALLTFPLMYAVQEMCARIGIACNMGLTNVVKQHYPKVFIYVLSLMVIPAIILNIAADIAGMAAVTNMFLPQIPPVLISLVIAIAILFSLILFSYKKIAAIMKYFTLTLVCYFIVPFLVKQDWKQVAFFTFVPHFKFDKEYISLLVAVLGTTISPYLFFWQASLSLEHKLSKRNSSHYEMKFVPLDISSGMFFSNLAMYFIILTTASVLFPHGITNINTVEEAAQALKPLAGDLAYIIFSVGILGVGFLAVPVLAACIGYIAAEIFDWKKGLDQQFKEAPEFYMTIVAALAIGVVINMFNIDPISSLIFTAIVYGVTAPFLIALILHICNNKKIMGKYTNKLFINILGFMALLLMSVVAIILVVSQFFV